MVELHYPYPIRVLQREVGYSAEQMRHERMRRRRQADDPRWPSLAAVVPDAVCFDEVRVGPNRPRYCSYAARLGKLNNARALSLAPSAAAWTEAALDRDASSRLRRGRGDSADLPEQAQSVPVDPFFDELAVDDMAEQLSVHVDRLAGGSGALQFPAVDPAQ
jgi:hypothetical protein